MTFRIGVIAVVLLSVRSASAHDCRIIDPEVVRLELREVVVDGVARTDVLHPLAEAELTAGIGGELFLDSPAARHTFRQVTP